MSYSPCGTCTDAIIPFTEKRPNCNVCIAFSCLYRHKKEEVHRDGLRQLNAEPRISIKVFTKIEWKTLAQATGRQYRGNKERDFTTVKKPELELSVSNLPSIVPDLPQELGGNARTVLNKPKEITSTSNKAKGKLFQVQPGGKKNNMVKNGVFPGDSDVSKSSSLKDQNRPNEISPKSSDHRQPQQEHTVIDIPEPKADQEQAVHPKKRRKEIIAIIIFVILISLAIILLIILGQWS
ncbi:hypothetical protein C0J52_24619 [Blattella germanica]|nr:hypothetical protein C0J52_24619 [Blattella germanica]